MTWQKILSKQIDVTGTTANQILISDGANAYWGNSSSSFDSSNLIAGLNGSNTNITNLQTGLTGSNTNITNLQTGLTGANTNIANITANPVTFQSDVTIQGNVFVRGNTLTFTSNTINFGDSLISLAANNTINDVIDIGLYGHYYNGTANSHTGLIRSAISKDWMLFTGYTIDLDSNSTINIAAPSFGYANLRLNSANALSIYSNGVELRANDYATLLAAYSNDASTYNTLNSRINTVQSNISASGAITVIDEGNTLTSTLSSMTFIGSGVVATNVGNDVTVTIPSENSNVITLQGGLSGANTNINTIQSNLTAYAAYANATFTGGGGGFSNGQSISVNSLVISSTLTANGNVGTATYVLTSNGAIGSPYWSPAASGTFTGGTISNDTIITSNTASNNAITGALQILGGLGVSNNIYAIGKIGFSNSTSSIAYTYYNSTTNSIDTIFG